MDHTHQHYESGRRSGRGKWVLLGFLAVTAFFLWTEHRAHLLGIVPYLLVLACPLMHLFHHGHGHRKSNSAPEPGNTKPLQEHVKERP